MNTHISQIIKELIMILRLTVNDNDFTEELEKFASDPTLTRFYCTTKLPQYQGWDTMQKMNRFRELFYSTEKYTPELIEELVESIKERWSIYVNYVMEDHEWWDADDAIRVRKYLIDDFKCKFQKSLTPKWENGEVVYLCCGYYNRWWTF